MSTTDFITQLFCRVDDAMHDVAKHSQATLYPGEVVTLAMLFCIKGVGNRAFYRWISNNHLSEFPSLPERTRLFRLFAAHKEWTARFMAHPTLLGVADTYGIELIHPNREGRSDKQIGKKGLSNRRWIVGGKLGLVLNKWGLVCGWDCATANVYDAAFQPMVAAFEGEMVILTDYGFHRQAKFGADPSNMLVCKRGEWPSRMMVESVLSMMHTVCHLKHMAHRVWRYFEAHLAYMMGAFNILAEWDGPAPGGLHPDECGRTHLSIAQFSL
jgi:hypothetical protein